MEQEQGLAIPGSASLPGEEEGRETDGMVLKDRGGPTWRGFVLAILAAIVLSVMATLLLGGSWSSYTLRPAPGDASGGFGTGGSCCPPSDSGN